MEFRADVLVPRPVEATWDAWVDAARFPQWQGGLLAIHDLTGPVERAGTTYTLEYGPKMERRTTITSVERPVLHVQHQTGFGANDVTTTTFEAEGDGTRVTVTIYLKLNRVLGVLSRLDRRSRLEREVQAELDRFAAVATRTAGPAIVGRQYVVRAGPFRRRLIVTGVDDGLTHVRLLPGWNESDDAAAAMSKQPGPFGSDQRLWSLRLPIRAPVDAGQRGLPFLLRDGGYGVEHLALSAGPWADAAGVDDGDAVVTDHDRAWIESWRADAGPVVGVDATVELAPLLTLRLGSDANGTDIWAVAKVLRAEMMRLHLTLYRQRWPERPAVVDPAVLRLERRDDVVEPGAAPDLSGAVAHLPLERAALGKAEPRLLTITTRRETELDRWRAWRDVGGASVASLQPPLDWPDRAPREAPAGDR